MEFFKTSNYRNLDKKFPRNAEEFSRNFLEHILLLSPRCQVLNSGQILERNKKENRTLKLA